MTTLSKYLGKLTRLEDAITEKQVTLAMNVCEEKIFSLQTKQNLTINTVDSHIFLSEGTDVDEKTKIELLAQDTVIIIGKGVRFLNCNIKVRGFGHIIYIANDCRLKQLTLHVNGKNTTVAIGSGTTVEHATILCESDENAVLLGNDCMLSSNIVIRTSDGHGVFDAATGERLSLPADVVIHAHVWIGNGARVSKGCVIGTGSILGQMALATGRLDSNSIYGGVPARKIRDGIVWSRTHRLADVPDEFRRTA